MHLPDRFVRGVEEGDIGGGGCAPRCVHDWPSDRVLRSLTAVFAGQHAGAERSAGRILYHSCSQSDAYPWNLSEYDCSGFIRCPPCRCCVNVSGRQFEYLASCGLIPRCIECHVFFLFATAPHVLFGQNALLPLGVREPCCHNLAQIRCAT